MSQLEYTESEWHAVERAYWRAKPGRVFVHASPDQRRWSAGDGSKMTDNQTVFTIGEMNPGAIHGSIRRPMSMADLRLTLETMLAMLGDEPRQGAFDSDVLRPIVRRVRTIQKNIADVSLAITRLKNLRQLPIGRSVLPITSALKETEEAVANVLSSLEGQGRGRPPTRVERQEFLLSLLALWRYGFGKEIRPNPDGPLVSFMLAAARPAMSRYSFTPEACRKFIQIYGKRLASIDQANYIQLQKIFPEKRRRSAL